MSYPCKLKLLFKIVFDTHTHTRERVGREEVYTLGYIYRFILSVPALGTSQKLGQSRK